MKMENFRFYIQEYVDKMLKEIVGTTDNLYSVLFDLSSDDEGEFLIFEIYDHNIQDKIDNEEPDADDYESAVVETIHLPFDFEFDYGLELLKKQLPYEIVERGRQEGGRA